MRAKEDVGEERRCSKCGVVRKCRQNPSCVNGRQKMCLKCLSKANRAWYELNREKKIEYQRKRYLAIKEAKAIKEAANK